MQTDYTLAETGQNDRKPLISRIGIALGVIAIVALVALLIWGIFWAATNHPGAIEALRDIVIIGLALGSCLFGVTFVIMLIMIVRLVNMLEFEIKPILQQTNETVRTLRGTTAFVSQNVVRPVTTASGYLAGFRRTIKVLFGEPRLPD
jgi:uncharacterized membrane protein